MGCPVKEMGIGLRGEHSAHDLHSRHSASAWGEEKGRCDKYVTAGISVLQQSSGRVGLAYTRCVTIRERLRFRMESTHGGLVRRLFLTCHVVAFPTNLVDDQGRMCECMSQERICSVSDFELEACHLCSNRHLPSINCAPNEFTFGGNLPERSLDENSMATHNDIFPDFIAVIFDKLRNNAWDSSQR